MTIKVLKRMDSTQDYDMEDKCMKLKRIVRFSLIIGFVALFFIQSTNVFANSNESETSEEDLNEDDELPDTFYRPKSTFTSSYDYEEYCKEMYRHGYMDENYNWTPAAQNYIDNMNAETLETLNKDAKGTVEQRVADGEMKQIDNPYISYDEWKRLSEENSKNKNSKNESNADTQTESESSSEGNAEISESPSKDDNTITVTPEEEQAEKEDEKPSSLANRIKLVFMVLLAVGIALVTYSIYKKQF
ncbi:hypothetical protein DMI82_04220 [Blautia sp. BCRC 81119]|nr:hypothetical protein DMI82_04220 [Blautia sp. BCRC 81119]